ncbi:L-rhamnose isomerase/sugar isomerase [Caldicoprobacter guelmensis]|uniref:L-rhamnose isomerase n=1 Tax=Caldicoprobacter guelmensis TaxID=1170224 RepID=UPI0019581CD4|nr:L-rhamnose isomerase [Caldicoprobacter guelmensis]MBM7581631.1 L-rhamnose isomerase/sugar isomerase [Caldicoprobacter guelmensis]
MTRDQIYSLWEQRQKDRGIDVEWVKERLKNFKVETPSWGYGDSGTRFKVFKQRGVPRNLFEKLEDAAQVHKVTGMCPTVAIHIPWDKVDDFEKVKEYAASLGLKIGAVNPNLFQDDDYKFGSLTNTDSAVRRKAIHHIMECIEIARKVDSRIISLWLADGTNYPGQGDIRARKNWLEEALFEVVNAMDSDMRLLIEYKFFEPAFYHTDIADWGMAYAFAMKLGEKAQVLVDLGHHPLGTNVEHIVAFLLDEGKIGGFHFNNKKYADDDLIVGSINPYELFLIFNELVAASLDPKTAKTAENIAYMIDQSHNIEPKIPAMIRSVLNVQTAYAKALLVNREVLKEAQMHNDVMAAEAAVREAFECDVTPLLEAVREEMGLAPDPMKAYLESGYGEKILERGIGGQGWE